MAEGAKIFPPSDHKLRELRRRGVVPYSRDVMTFAVFLGTAAALAVLVRGSAVEDLKNGAAAVFSGSSASFSPLLAKGLAALAAAAAVVVVCGVFQTRFLIFWGAGGAEQPASGLELFAGIIKSLCCFALLPLIGAKLLEETVKVENLRMAYGAIDAVFEGRGFPAGAAAAVAPALLAAAAVGLLLCLFLSIVSRFVVVLTYRARHSMTRSEVEAENRELEMKPEVKDAQRILGEQ